MIDQVMRLGCMTAYERTLHLLLELRDRMLRAGLASAHAIPLPISQETLSNVLGVSVVHMNRTLQQLRRDNIIDYRARRLEFKDVAAAVDMVDYRSAGFSRPRARAHEGHVFR
jgi:CRP-like cAMP-binding protein